MTDQQREMVDQLFEQVVGMPTVDRAAFLAASQVDEVVRLEVESLLKYAQTQGTRGLDVPVEAMARLFSRQAAADETQIGPYRILGVLGEGGMGRVYRAVRADDQYRKTVAIKVVRLESQSAFALQRFRQERQILANLEHPNIARLLDGGTSDGGIPFIAMEYVQGRPITVYCRENQLGIRQKLELFRLVCNAVQYAHQMLVVHRDIKPANILVTSEGIPKLLDFGIAKLLDTEIAGEDTNTQTMTGFRMMTPDYASPEQVRGQAATTATDIYSLGVVLYELLTGERPHRLTTYDPLEIARQVCETEVRPPSLVGEAALRGDLDTIVLKALHKEMIRRYSSVEQFSEDIRRYLDGRPVLARPDTLFYRAGKFVGRNRFSVATAGVAAVALVGGIVAEQRQARIAEERFEIVRGIARKVIYDIHDEVAKMPGSTKPREIIVSAGLDYLDKLSSTAGDNPKLLVELANAYVKVGSAQGFPAQPNLGRTKEAKASTIKGLELAERAARRDPAARLTVVDIAFRLSTLNGMNGDLKSAEEYYRKGMVGAEALLKENPSDAKTLSLLAIANATLGDLKESDDAEAALAAYRKCLEYQQKLTTLKPTAENKLRMARAALRIGTAATLAGALGESLRSILQSQAWLGELLKAEPGNPVFLKQSALTYQDLSYVYEADERPSLGDWIHAVEAARNYVAANERIVAMDKNDANGLFSLAVAEMRLSNTLRFVSPDEALGWARKSLEHIDSNKAANGGNHLWVSRRARILRRLAGQLTTMGRGAEAQARAAEALEIERGVLAGSANSLDEQRVMLWTLVTAAEAELAAGDRAAAKARYEEALVWADRLAGHQPTQYSLMLPAEACYRGLGSLLRKSGEERRGKELEAKAEAIKWWPGRVRRG